MPKASLRGPVNWLRRNGGLGPGPRDGVGDAHGVRPQEEVDGDLVETERAGLGVSRAVRLSPKSGERLVLRDPSLRQAKRAWWCGDTLDQCTTVYRVPCENIRTLNTTSRTMHALRYTKQTASRTRQHADGTGGHAKRSARPGVVLMIFLYICIVCVYIYIYIYIYVYTHTDTGTCTDTYKYQ